MNCSPAPTKQTKPRACDSGKPNCQQVDKAKQDARNASSEAGDDAQTVFDIISAILGIKGGFDWFGKDLDPKVQKLLTVLLGALGDVEVNLRLLQAAFWSQTIEPDSYWMDPLNLVNFQGNDGIASVLINLYAAVGLAVATYFTLEADPVVGIAFGAAAVASIGMMVYMPYRISQTVGDERKDLGY